MMPSGRSCFYPDATKPIMPHTPELRGKEVQINDAAHATCLVMRRCSRQFDVPQWGSHYPLVFQSQEHCQIQYIQFRTFCNEKCNGKK